MTTGVEVRKFDEGRDGTVYTAKIPAGTTVVELTRVYQGATWRRAASSPPIFIRYLPRNGPVGRWREVPLQFLRPGVLRYVDTFRVHRQDLNHVNLLVADAKDLAALNLKFRSAHDG